MTGMKPKEQHERMLAKVDNEAIVQHLSVGRQQDITRIAVALARQCDLLVHFRRLWTMRVADLDPALGSESYMRNIFENRTALYKQLVAPKSR